MGDPLFHYRTACRSKKNYRTATQADKKSSEITDHNRRVIQIAGGWCTWKMGGLRRVSSPLIQYVVPHAHGQTVSADVAKRGGGRAPDFRAVPASSMNSSGLGNKMVGGAGGP